MIYKIYAHEPDLADIICFGGRHWQNIFNPYNHYSDYQIDKQCPSYRIVRNKPYRETIFEEP